MRAIMLFAIAVALVACEREKRDFEPPQGNATAPLQRNSPLQPGQAIGTAPAGAPQMPTTAYTAETNAFAVAQGKRLYRWYNCSACHAPGGGGDWGPALSDAQWIYGFEPKDIFVSIAQGRPNGMPSFASHISEDQIWQLVAYVRSLSGQLRSDVAPGRSDSLSANTPESRREPEKAVIHQPKDGAQR
jgi:cytochrome c oxidase cbb3-type subunit 3